MKNEKHLRAALAASILAGLCASTVHASQLSLYLSQPARSSLASDAQAVPDAALPWPSSYDAESGTPSYTIETFDGEIIEGKSTGEWAVGSYKASEGSNTNVSAANQYGGAGTGSAMGSGGSNFLNAGVGGDPAGVTITLNEPARYVGFWWSAGSSGNFVELLDEHDNRLTAMTTNDLMLFLNDQDNLEMEALGGAVYDREQYNGNPFFGSPANPREPYVYLNYVLKDDTGFGATTIRKIRFSGSGFELDNVAVRESAMPGLPGDAGLPPSWVPTEITSVIIDPPVTGDDPATTRINTPYPAFDLRGNDPYTPDGSIITMPTAASPNGGTLVEDPNNSGKYIYTPANGFHGVDTFTYQVCLPQPDPAADLCATATVTVTVQAPDMAVDLSALPQTAVVGEPYSGTFTCTNKGDASAQEDTTCTTEALPAGITVQACVIRPDADDSIEGEAWRAGQVVPVGAVVTCEVAGEAENVKGNTTAEGSTGATGDVDPTNDTDTQDITVIGYPDMVIDLTGLPSTGTVNKPYTGTFTCTNQGTEVAPQGSTTCAIASLPEGLTVGVCTIAPANTPWAAGDSVPEDAIVTCPVTGEPVKKESPKATGSTGTIDDSNTGNNTDDKVITIDSVPDMAIDLTGLPTQATVGETYEGSFTCTNVGSADAQENTTCTTGPLPAGLSVGACTISPSGSTWTPGTVVPVNAVVTCEVTGKPDNVKITTTAIGTTGGTDDFDEGNNTATKDIEVIGVPDVVIDLSGLPPTGNVGVPYKGTFSCTNQGTADSDASTVCNATNLPNGIELVPGSCTIVTLVEATPTPWGSPAAIAENATVTCAVEGTPKEIGPSTVDGTGGGNTSQKEVTIGAALPPVPVPSLSTWATLMLTILLAVIGFGQSRKRNA